MTRPWIRAVLFGILVVIFLIVNRGAYQGYFLGDDLDNVYWTPFLPLTDFITQALSPALAAANFRPAGHLYFHILSKTAGLDYPPYVAVLQALHLLNVWLLYMLLRRMKLEFPAAAAGALFFAFQMAAFDAFWKPMYVFDVLCGTFCLLSMLSYSHRRYILSFLCMWLAYKAKELAIALPVMLLAWEWWLGEKRWKHLVPFFLFSLMFGTQALFHRPEIGSPYRMRFTLKAVRESVSFYSSTVFFAPFAGLATLALPFFFRDRRVWLGIAGFWIFLGPLLFLPSRLFPAYLYVPLAALSIAVAAIASGRRIVYLILFFAIWLPVNHVQLKAQRKSALALGDENRRYLESATGYFRVHPETGAVVIDGEPESLNRWGTDAAVHIASGNQKLLIRHAGDPDANEALNRKDLLVLSWDRHLHRVGLRGRIPGEPPPSWMDMGSNAPIWLLGDGWRARNGLFRWIEPRATVTLHRPEGCGQFGLRVTSEPASVELLLDGESMGVRQFVRTGVQETEWRLPPKPGGDVRVEFRVSSPYRDEATGKRLGIAVMAFGFMGE